MQVVYYFGAGIGKTVKEKVCVHTSRDIRGIASQLVNVWLEVFRKEKASNGGLKFSRQSATKSVRDPAAKPPLHTNHGALVDRGNIQVSASNGSHLSLSANVKKVNGKVVKLESATYSKPENNSLRSQGSTRILDIDVEDGAAMTEEEKAAIAAAEAARAAALAAVEVCFPWSSSCYSSLLMSNLSTALQNTCCMTKPYQVI